MIEKLIPYYGLFKYIGAILFCTLLLAYVYNKGYDSAEIEYVNKYNAEVIKIKDNQMKEYIRLSDNYHAVSTEYQEFLKNNKATVEIIHDTKIKEIEKPIYSECIIPVTGVQNLNDSTRRLNEDRKAKNPS